MFHRDYLKYLQDSDRLDDNTHYFLKEVTSHDFVIGKIEIDFYQFKVILQLDYPYMARESYLICYSGVDFSKSILMIQNELQVLVDEIVLEQRFLKHDFLVISFKREIPEKLTIICDDLKIIKKQGEN